MTVLVFVYGTLVEPDRADAILDDWQFVGDATLVGLHRVEGAYPTLAPGGSVEGRVLWTPEIDWLDAYEGVERGLYVRVSVPVEGGSTAEVYVGDPERLDAPVTWPGEGAFGERVRAHLANDDIAIRMGSTRRQ